MVYSQVKGYCKVWGSYPTHFGGYLLLYNITDPNQKTIKEVGYKGSIGALHCRRGWILS